MENRHALPSQWCEKVCATHTSSPLGDMAHDRAAQATALESTAKPQPILHPCRPDESTQSDPAIIRRRMARMPMGMAIKPHCNGPRPSLMTRAAVRARCDAHESRWPLHCDGRLDHACCQVPAYLCACIIDGTFAGACVMHHTRNSVRLIYLCGARPALPNPSSACAALHASKAPRIPAARPLPSLPWRLRKAAAATAAAAAPRASSAWRLKPCTDRGAAH